MCGIFGYVCEVTGGFPERFTKSALGSLKARGPDGTSWLGITPAGEQKWKRETDCEPDKHLLLSMGCSRLAINDVSDSGLQPLCSQNGNIWVVLNGEIFNFVELRTELEGRGYRFKTGTDTEVVANAFEAWGEDCFERFNGQFAIAVLDKSDQQFILARDRVGIVPLYVREFRGGMTFASEIKAILTLPMPEPRPDVSRIAVQIGLPYKLHAQPGTTLYEDIYQIQPGQIVFFNRSGRRRSARFYWRADSVAPMPNCSFLDARDRLRELLIDCVRIRLRTDRKLAFIVSGGVDSPAVLGIAKQLFGVNTETFSLDLPDARFNENDSIREVLSDHGLPENFIPVTASHITELTPDVVGYSDEPLATPNAVLHAIMARAIDASGTRVVLNGVGGDEVFLGYHDHFLYHLLQMKVTDPSRFARELTGWSHLQGRPKELFERFCSFVESSAARTSPDFLARSQGFDYRKILCSDVRKDCLREASLFRADDHTTVGKQIQDLTRLTIPHAVRMDDNCYLSQSVEARQPFLDHRLIEFGLSLPARFKIRNGISKYILRQAVRGLVRSSRRRDVRKVGLNLPIDVWMRTSLRDWVNDSLANRNDAMYAFADYEKVQAILRQHQTSEANHSLKIWDLCCISSWLRGYSHRSAHQIA